MNNNKEINAVPEGILSAILMALLVFFLSMQVILRFVFNRSLAWNEEVIRICFVWSVFLGFVLAAYKDKHIRVTVALWSFSEKIQRYILSFADLFWIIFNVIMIYYGTLNVLEMIRFPMISQTLGINLLYTYIVIPLSFAWMSVRVVQTSIIRLKGKSEIKDSRLDTA